MKNLKKRGFTLIEMLIVVVIIGILAAALIPRLGSAKGKANDASRNTALSQIGTAFGVYVMDYTLANSAIASTGSNLLALSGNLKAGGLSPENFPKNPDGTSPTIFGISSSGYVIIPVSKGTAGSGYIVATQVESAASANWVEFNNVAGAEFSGGRDITAVTLCTAVTEGTPSATQHCQYSGANQLRKIVAY